MTVRERRWLDRSGRAHSSWIVDVQATAADGTTTRFRGPSPVQTEAGARAYELEQRSRIAEDTKTKTKRVPRLREFAGEFLEHASANNEPSTVDEKRSILRTHLVPAFGELRLDHIDIRKIEAFKAAVHSSGLEKKTINNILAVLSRVLTLALEFELIARMPRIKRLKLSEADFDFLDFGDAERLVAAAESDPEWQRFILIALRTGLRRGELLALRWEDVDLVLGRIVVRRSSTRGRIGPPKGKRWRELELGPRALAALKAQRHLRSELVFCNADGSQLADEDPAEPLALACRRAGLRRVGCQVLRHTFASHLAMRGETIKTIQELLGHVDIRTTLRYAHLSPRFKRVAMERLDEPAPATWADGRHASDALREPR